MVNDINTERRKHHDAKRHFFLAPFLWRRRCTDLAVTSLESSFTLYVSYVNEIKFVVVVLVVMCVVHRKTQTKYHSF
jgi:hypothetical protein